MSSTTIAHNKPLTGGEKAASTVAPGFLGEETISVPVGERPLPKYAGIIPPVVTPLAGPDALDVEGAERLIARILDGGVNGLFLLGTTGEGPSLSYRLRREYIQRVVRQVNGRVPVLVGITDTSFAESLSLAGYAAEVGADALVFAPPYYFPPGSEELLEYVRQMDEKLPLPYFLYNMPSLTKVSIGPEVIKESIQKPKCLGMKDSSGDMTYYKHLLRLAAEREDYRVLIGPEELLAESLLAGGQGGVTGSANVFPKLFVRIFHAAWNGDYATAAKYQKCSVEISARLFRIGKYGSSIIKGIKGALGCKGVCSDLMAAPFGRFGPEDRARLQEVLEALDALLPADVR